MEQNITHSDGTTASLQSRAAASGITKMEQSRTFMGDDTLNIEVSSAQTINFRIGDTIKLHGRPYSLNKAHTPKKEGDRRYHYTLPFEGVQYELINAQFLLFDNITDDAVAHPSQHTLDGMMMNSLTGNAADILKMIVLNANRVHGDETWAVGTTPATSDTLNFTLEAGTCLEALQALCEQWELEWEITTDGTTGQHTINLTAEPATEPAPLTTFSYGRTGGLYTTERTPKGEMVTRLYAYGSTQNVPTSYLQEANTSRLCIKNGNQRKQHLSYVENATLKQQYGIREKVEIYDDIYPQRVGTVTNIYTTGDKFWLKFRDNDMFNLNARDPQTGETLYLIPGATAKVTFQTGQLSGYSFDIVEYNDSNRRFTLKQVKEEGDLTLPSETVSSLRIKVGDKYILTDINLPEVYITDAETQLKEMATKKLAQMNADLYSYNVELDSRYVKKHATSWGRTADEPFMPGDFIAITDWELNTTTTLRLTSFTHDLLTDKWTLTIQRYQPRIKTTQTRHRRNVRRWWLDRLEHQRIVNSQFNADEAYQLADMGMDEIVAGRGSYPNLNGRMTAINTTANNAQTSANKAVNDISILRRYTNNVNFADRHIDKMPSFEDNKLVIEGGTTITDTLSKLQLGFAVNQWAKIEGEGIDFANGEYETDASYDIYAILKEDGTIEYKAVKQGEETSAEYLLLGVVSAEDGNGNRTYTTAIAQGYMDAGVLRDSGGKAVLDIENKLMNGATKISGLKATAQGADLDLVTLLGALPTTAGGLRKQVADKLNSTDIELTLTAGGGKIRLGQNELPLKVIDDNGTKKLIIGNDGLAFDAQGNISVKNGNQYVAIFRALTPTNTKIQNGTIYIDNNTITPVSDSNLFVHTTDAAWTQLVSKMDTLVRTFDGMKVQVCDDKQCYDKTINF